ncbi:MAG: hypothetical protein QG622_461 [Actinomycetota bacterium]|nr:hypothetical protein [Actinomycetota bacterium]
MNQLVFFASDIVAACLLVFGLYFPRHRRRDLVVSYLAVNIGVLAVAEALGNMSGGAGVGMGLGLFGVLSIIRLRSTQLDHHEVAYYFCALALGLLGALGGSVVWISPALMVMILFVMFLADHPKLFHGHQRQLVVLDVALSDHFALVSRLEEVLHAKVHAVSVQKVDLVNDMTWVDVRYEPNPVTVPDEVPDDVPSLGFDTGRVRTKS